MAWRDRDFERRPLAGWISALERGRFQGHKQKRERRETGKEYGVRVHCDEGVATYVAPDPGAVLREDDREASVGERIGQPLSRESVINSGADVVRFTEGNT